MLQIFNNPVFLLWSSFHVEKRFCFFDWLHMKSRTTEMFTNLNRFVHNLISVPLNHAKILEGHCVPVSYSINLKSFTFLARVEYQRIFFTRKVLKIVYSKCESANNISLTTFSWRWFCSLCLLWYFTLRNIL